MNERERIIKFDILNKKNIIICVLPIHSPPMSMKFRQQIRIEAFLKSRDIHYMTQCLHVIYETNFRRISPMTQIRHRWGESGVCMIVRNANNRGITMDNI